MLAAKLTSAAQSLQGALERLGAASSDQMNELRSILERQKSTIIAHEKTIEQLRSTLGAHATHPDRVAALEEKVFKPGFFGRLFGRKGPTNAPCLPSSEE